MYTKIRDVYGDYQKYIGKTLTFGGWIKTLRDNKNIGFIQLNDGSNFNGVQIVISDDLNNFDEVKKLGVGSSISVTGVLVESQGAEQNFEMQATEIVVEGIAPSDYPLQKKRHTFEYLRTIAHLRPRANTFQAVFKIRSLLSYAIHKFFNERGFIYVHTPILTGSDAEGAGEMFQVTNFDLNNVPKTKDGEIDYKEDFFGKMVHLTVSGQLNAETFATAFRDCYTFGPTFRAENSNTTRHAAEFWMIEPEMAFVELEENMDVVEDMVKYVIKYVLEHGKPEMEFFNSFIDKGLFERLNNIVNNEFERITYTQAVEILEKSGKEFTYPIKWGVELQTEHEKYITEEIYKKPVFVTDYPKGVKAFYMRENEDGKTVRATDLLVPGIGELVGGSQREERYDVLCEKIKAMGMELEDYDWYLDLRKYGTVKHSGFGLGFERLVMYVTGMTNIRDVIPYPRTANNAEF